MTLDHPGPVAIVAADMAEAGRGFRRLGRGQFARGQHSFGAVGHARQHEGSMRDAVEWPGIIAERRDIPFVVVILDDLLAPRLAEEEEVGGLVHQTFGHGDASVMTMGIEKDSAPKVEAGSAAEIAFAAGGSANQHDLAHDRGDLRRQFRGGVGDEVKRGADAGRGRGEFVRSEGRKGDAGLGVVDGEAGIETSCAGDAQYRIVGGDEIDAVASGEAVRPVEPCEKQPGRVGILVENRLDQAGMQGEEKGRHPPVRHGYGSAVERSRVHACLGQGIGDAEQALVKAAADMLIQTSPRSWSGRNGPGSASGLVTSSRAHHRAVSGPDLGKTDLVGIGCLHQTGGLPGLVDADLGAARPLGTVRRLAVAEDGLFQERVLGPTNLNFLHDGLSPLGMVSSKRRSGRQTSMICADDVHDYTGSAAEKKTPPRSQPSPAAMILFLTTRGHEFGVKLLVERAFPALPECRTMTYEDMFLATDLPVATYVFCDIERLAPWEARLAAERYRSLRKAGMRCLNDPARVMLRRELLRKLFRRKINPFNVYAADLRPRPKKFPVFIRSEAEHQRVFLDLLPDQKALDRKLRLLTRQGWALRHLLVVEFTATPIAPGVWQRTGTFRIGDGLSVDSFALENHWRVANGTKGLATEAMFQAENDAVRANALAEAVRPAFEMAEIEYGRCDHATHEGREVIFEINTNPTISPIEGQRLPIREETLRFSRARMAEMLQAIDTAGEGRLDLPLSPEMGRLAVVEAKAIVRP